MDKASIRNVHITQGGLQPEMTSKLRKNERTKTILHQNNVYQLIRSRQNIFEYICLTFTVDYKPNTNLHNDNVLLFLLSCGEKALGLLAF